MLADDTKLLRSLHAHGDDLATEGLVTSDTASGTFLPVALNPRATRGRPAGARADAVPRRLCVTAEGTHVFYNGAVSPPGLCATGSHYLYWTITKPVLSATGDTVCLQGQSLHQKDSQRLCWQEMQTRDTPGNNAPVLLAALQGEARLPDTRKGGQCGSGDSSDLLKVTGLGPAVSS